MILAFLMLAATPSGENPQTPPLSAEQSAAEQSAVEQSPTPAEQPVHKADKPKKDKRVCRESGRSGMFMTYKVCKKQSEWDADALKASGALGDSINKLDNIDRNKGG